MKGGPEARKKVDLEEVYDLFPKNLKLAASKPEQVRNMFAEVKEVCGKRSQQLKEEEVVEKFHNEDLSLKVKTLISTFVQLKGLT